MRKKYAKNSLFTLFSTLTLISSVLLSNQASAESKPESFKGSMHPDMRLAPCPKSPNCVNSLHYVDKKHYVKPLVLPEKADMSDKDIILEVLNQFERVKIVRIDDHYIRAEFKSRIFGFVDDVEFLIKDGHTDIRSASRVGYSDLGANRNRVDKIREALSQFN